MESVTASELVRHFGVWRDRALARPVYVHHHGRAKLVLASVDLMEHLVASRGVGTADHSIGALLRVIDAITIVTDGDLRIVGATDLARRYLLQSDHDSERLDTALIDGVGSVLLRAVRLVIGGGSTERLQLRVGLRAERLLDVTIVPSADGVCILAKDRTAADAAAAAAAGTAAIEQALRQMGDVAILRINLRGYIVEASPTFEKMTGLPAGGYRSVRLPTLFDLPTRVGVGDALEKAIETLEPSGTNARLVSNSGTALPVCISFSAEMLRAAEGAVIAAIKVSLGGLPQA